MPAHRVQNLPQELFEVSSERSDKTYCLQPFSPSPPILQDKMLARGWGGGDGGYSGYFWVGVCRWDFDALTLY